VQKAVVSKDSEKEIAAFLRIHAGWSEASLRKSSHLKSFVTTRLPHTKTHSAACHPS